MVSLSIFILCYLGFIFNPKQKASISLLGAFGLTFFGFLPWGIALREIHWNVVGLFVGTLFLADLFMHSRVPAVLAERLVDKTKTAQMALVSLFILASMMSMFVENVAVVLLLSPVALALCDKMAISPVRPLILLAMFSNLQGTATLIGDPPSMILGSYMKMSFGDFFFYQGKPSIFFIVQAGALSTLVLSYGLFRHQKQLTMLVQNEEIRSWMPTLLLVLLVVILAFSSHFDREAIWLAGTTAMVLGIVGLIWHHVYLKWQPTTQMIKSLDWETVFFLVGLFVLVGAIRVDGWMDTLASWVIDHLPPNLMLIYSLTIFISLLVSAFVDNVPYLIAMLPVIQHIAEVKEMSPHLLVFGLLVGTCLGGNITPIGASANIVAVGFLEKRGYKVDYPSFVPLGLVFTSFAVIPGALVLWFIWS